MIKNVDPYDIEEIGFHLGLIKSLTSATQDSFDSIATSTVKYKEGDYDANALANECLRSVSKVDDLLTILYNQLSDTHGEIYKLVDDAVHSKEGS